MSVNKRSKRLSIAYLTVYYLGKFINNNNMQKHVQG